MKQLKEIQWLELFEKYHDYKNGVLGKNEFESFYRSIRGVSYFDNKSRYTRKYFVSKYNRYNLGMIDLNSQTGKATKKGKGTGRPKKRKITPVEIARKEWKKCQKSN
ncbi:hypothetical protein [Mycoplasmopsis pullorum]|uniref:Uncharacterized protein n=1 Tax=Mycoplasmopsis pullorum TaxID=48003 RepID=A0A1L4FR79_9BACT|nr:hypothetical protein [Mycoplasmopsis pullorum]APJ38114.1 hypothetical protein BLA55_00180 [Mycoplasmopsis pullorum]APJ38772.1 hypothetical protein BLA55_03880 [Mycoplasmopsis pullorum]APJ38775.1 hypothetical protein BLA55_03905 [Mycoplasmopsis pullorum]